MRVSEDGLSVVVEDEAARWPPLIIRNAIENGSCGQFKRPGGARIQVTSDPSSWINYFCHERLPSGKLCLHAMVHFVLAKINGLSTCSVPRRWTTSTCAPAL
jgi:hypothetical protein